MSSTCNKDSSKQKDKSNNGNYKNNSNGNHGKKHARLCPGRDTYERMNFLYQASMLMSESMPALSGSYGKLVKSIGKKAVLRIEPAIKRTLCTRCGVALNPATTANYSDFRHKKLSYLEVECKLCGFTKRYYNNKNHKIRLDDPESVVETMVFEQ
ncbi:uncharacterized protein LOC131683858 isoform X2 [Topomyia yanbarensis]|uniref:uncharacterized protein LOC131683858 isoform X2 n=1 Tax=Topomyia yanbarensis TaxID=2498891 RepID=UPI00273B5A44|nr:uncharacterized protein LOC131683858 isoform X2 [Topomyia yanbarensis]XP_058822201.1 uncharacterized protein LOC131683858 isoform X2 [Topomyia yanbarensis]